MTSADWEDRVAAAWAAIDDLPEEKFLAVIGDLADELPAESPLAMFERACAFDSTGHPDLAVPLYQRGLDLGLTGLRRRRAMIQLASSLRNLGRPAESVELLTRERDVDPAQLDAAAAALDDAVAGFLALALVDVGRDREAVSLALRALAPHLPRYQRSLGNYARYLIEPEEEDED